MGKVLVLYDSASSKSCAPALGSPCSMADRMRVTSLMPFKIADGDGPANGERGRGTGGRSDGPTRRPSRLATWPKKEDLAGSFETQTMSA
jgi:hypothetical protein